MTIMRVRLVIFALVIAPVLLAISPIQAQILGLGWTGTFYLGTELSGDPIAEDVPYPTGLCANWESGVPRLGTNMPCAPGEPVPNVPADNFSARFVSTQTFVLGGTYRFTIVVDDAARLIVDGVTIFDEFTQTGNLSTYQFEHFLSAGDHTLQFEYAEFTGNAVLQVQWGNTGIPDDGLITNGSFEQSTIAPWVIKQATGDQVKCNKDTNGDGIFDKIVSYEGACAFRFKGVPGETSKIQQTRDDISLNTGDSLDLKFYARSKGGGIIECKVRLKYSNGTKTKILLQSATNEVYT